MSYFRRAIRKLNMNKVKEPLYRKDNKTPYNYRGNTGGHYRHTRHTKKVEGFEGNRMSMKSGEQRGVDYTPLFRFLLSKIGQDWSKVHSEAVSRLDKPDPIWWMVAIDESDKKERVRIGESSLWSGLYVDENNLLQKVNPNYTVNEVYPSCPCCTCTFNGSVVTNKYKE